MKAISRIVLYLLLVTLLTSCTGQTAMQPAAQDEQETLVVYSSIYPIYALTKSLTADLLEVKMAMTPGADPHDFEPSAKLIAEISAADILFYNGLGMEPWIERGYQALAESGTHLVNLSENVVLLEVASADHDDHDEDDHDDAEQHEEEVHHHGKYDPHIWLDPNNAIAMTDQIYQQLAGSFTGEELAILKNNYNVTLEKLTELDAAYRAALKTLDRREIIVGHAAFGYLAQRYDLQQIAIAGLSTLDEPSAALMSEIVEQAKRHQATTVFYDALGSAKLADVIASEVSLELVPLHTLGMINQDLIEEGEDYFSLMYFNLNQLTQALND